MRGNTFCHAMIIVGVVLAGRECYAATRYAKVSGTGDCSNWANACDLSTAITNASLGDEIWVRAGTYAPFSLKNGVKIIGGFAGTETLASQSNPAVNETIVDGGTSGQCVWSTNNAASTVLRGFAIQNGHDATNNGGGGLVADNSSALFVQCVFQNNTASMFGAGAAVRGSSSPQFVNCTFRDNGSGSGTNARPMGGGAVFVHNGSPTFVNCLFHNNKAVEGGVLVVASGTPTFINCTLANNTAEVGAGGAIFDQNGATVVRNSILWSNSAAREGDQVFNLGSARSTITYSNVQGGYAGTSNIDADPLFQRPGSGSYRLRDDSSPCYNAGQNSVLPADSGDLDWDNNTAEQLPKDLDGNARRVLFVVDQGAYEVPRDIN